MILNKYQSSISQPVREKCFQMSVSENQANIIPTEEPLKWILKIDQLDKS